jgi:hypothetical protein
MDKAGISGERKGTWEEGGEGGEGGNLLYLDINWPKKELGRPKVKARKWLGSVK